mgnify:FL=1
MIDAAIPSTAHLHTNYHKSFLKANQISDFLIYKQEGSTLRIIYDFVL